MARLFRPVVIALAAATVVVPACSGFDAALTQHREKLESLGATTKAIAEAWVDGNVSGTYTRTALEQTRQLVEQERTALASKAGALADPRGARLSEAAERLSRLLALMIHDVEGGDSSALRQRASHIPILPPPQP